MCVARDCVFPSCVGHCMLVGHRVIRQQRCGFQCRHFLDLVVLLVCNFVNDSMCCQPRPWKGNGVNFLMGYFHCMFSLRTCPSSDELHCGRSLQHVVSKLTFVHHYRLVAHGATRLGAANSSIFILSSLDVLTTFSSTVVPTLSQFVVQMFGCRMLGSCGCVL